MGPRDHHGLLDMHVSLDELDPIARIETLTSICQCDDKPAVCDMVEARLTHKHHMPEHVAE
jgi:hypothetical protein